MGLSACSDVQPGRLLEPDSEAQLNKTPLVCPALPSGTSAVLLVPSNATIGVGRAGDLQLTNQAGVVIPDCQVKWTSSDTRTATVNATGLVTGLRAGGPITIRATTNTKPALVGSASITVSAVPVTTVTINPTTGALLIGGQMTLTATTSANGTTLTNRIVRWSSQHPAIATVDSMTGVVTGIARGSATIRATSEGISATATVSVDQVGSITIAPDSVRLVKDEQIRVTATVRDIAGTVINGATVTWSQIGEGVTIASNGVVTATTDGRAYSGSLTASVGGLSTSIIYRVGPNLRGLNLNGQNYREGNLSWADLTGATAVRTVFWSTVLVGAKLENVDLSWSLLRGTDFSTATISNVNFDRAIFDRGTRWPTGFALNGRGLLGPGIDMTGLDLRGIEAGFGRGGGYIDLSDGNLTRAMMEGVNFYDANFARANLSDANLRSAGLGAVDLSDAILTSGTVLTEAVYDDQTQWPSGFDFINKGMYGPRTNLSGADRSYRVLRYVPLRGANLSSARLIGTNFEYSDLRECNLRNADLRETGLFFVDLSDADLTDADLRGAFYNDATKWPTGFDPVAAGAIRR